MYNPTRIANVLNEHMDYEGERRKLGVEARKIALRYDWTELGEETLGAAKNSKSL